MGHANETSSKQSVWTVVETTEGNSTPWVVCYRSLEAAKGAVAAALEQERKDNEEFDEPGTKYGVVWADQTGLSDGFCDQTETAYLAVEAKLEG